MRIITGDNTGLTKVVNVEKTKVISTFGEQEKDNEQDFLSFFGTETLILSGNKKGELQLNEINEEGEFQRLVAMLDNQKDLAGLNTIDSNKVVLTYRNNTTELASFDAEKEEFLEFQELYKSNQKGIVQTTTLNQQDKKQLLVLSKDVNPQIYDIETGQQAWKARNVKNDWLDLQVPIFDVSGSFLPNSQTICTANAFKKMRLYDLRANNSQPVKDIELDLKFDKTAFRQMELSTCGSFAYVTTANGNLFKLDVRKDFRMMFNFKGSTGSIKDMQVHPTLPYIASVSLDRYLRVYNTDTKEMISKTYLKQRLHSLIFSQEGIIEDSANQDDNKEQQENKDEDDFIPPLIDEEDEELFENEQGNQKKKRMNNKEIKTGEKPNDRTRTIEQISKQRAYQELVSHKQKFENLKKHSIQLSYLKDKMSKKNQQQQEKVEEDQVIQEYEDEGEEQIQKKIKN